MPTAAIKTLGCKLNQYDSEGLREQLERLGFVSVDFEQPADVYLINTCTVTARSEKDARKLARQARRRSPVATVVITGCYAQTAPEVLRALPEVDLVVGVQERWRLPELLAQHLGLSVGNLPEEALLDHFSGHTRSFLLVQEGCNSHCAYCLVPAARGPSRSVPAQQVMAQAQRLAEHGHPELVLIGTHLGQYGVDRPGEWGLAQLLQAICDLPAVQRVRLSSIEPCEVNPELVDRIALGGRALTGGPSGKLCRHLHIPLQSGSDSVLARMNRPYDTGFYADLVRRIHARQPDTFLGADVIVGFPGETEEEFAATATLLESLPLSSLHVFSYSIRPGTPAATMPDQVHPESKQARSAVLREMSERKLTAFAASMVGKRLEVALQQPAENGCLSGISDNYLTVLVEAPDDQRGRLVTVEIQAAEGAVLRGKLV